MLLLGAAQKYLVTQGTLIATEASGRTRRYGTAAAGWPDLGLCFDDARVPIAIARSPSTGKAEAIIDDRLTIKDGDVMAFVGFIRRNNSRDKDGGLDNLGVLEKMRVAVMNRSHQVNQRASSRRNVAHHEPRLTMGKDWRKCAPASPV